MHYFLFLFIAVFLCARIYIQLDLKKGNVLFNDTHFLFMVIWHQTYGKEPLRQGEWKPAAAT